MLAKEVIIVLQVIAIAVAQSPATLNNDTEIWVDVEDYIFENRLQYNATLKSYVNQINDVKDSLEDQLKVIEKEKVLLLNTIQETYEKIRPLEVLSLPTRYCVQQYRAEIPYSDIIKANIESCITSARSYSSTIVSSPNSYYTQLNSYYSYNLKTGLNNCAKSHSDPSLNYTLCVTSVISQANSYTITNRNNFAAAIESSECSLNSRVDIAVSCMYSELRSGLTSIGAATRLIHECINDYLEPDNNNNGTISHGCPNVIYLEANDASSQNGTLANQLQARSLTCLEIRFV